MESDEATHGKGSYKAVIHVAFRGGADCLLQHPRPKGLLRSKSTKLRTEGEDSNLSKLLLVLLLKVWPRPSKEPLVTDGNIHRKSEHRLHRKIISAALENGQWLQWCILFLCSAYFELRAPPQASLELTCLRFANVEGILTFH